MTEKPKILVVDDEPRMAESIKILLEGSGYEIFTCYSGKDAIRKISEDLFDLVLLDLVMPEIDGFEVLERIYNMREAPLVIVVTGQVTVDSAVTALTKGAYDYLRKPCSQEELLKKVHNALIQKELKTTQAILRRRLEQSEERYRLLVQASPDIIYTLDRDGRFAFVNESTERFLGLHRSELIGSHYTTIVVDEDSAKARHVFNERRAGDRAFRGVVLRLKQGRSLFSMKGDAPYLTVELKATGLYERTNPDGSPVFVGSYGVARDVGKRIETEKALRENEERYRALFTNNPVETVVVDRSAIITDINLAKTLSGDRIPRIGDIMYRDYAGKHDTDMYEELMDSIHTERSKEFKEKKYGEKYLHIRISPFSAGAIITSTDITNQKLAEAELRETIKRMETAYEQAALYAQEVTDEIAQRKRIEEALRESNEKYRTLLEASPDPIVVYDMKGRVIYLTPAFTTVFGWTLDELSGKQIDFVPDEYWPETLKMIEKISNGKSFSGFESRRRTKTGAIVDVDISAAVYRDKDGTPIGSIIDLRDITAQRRMEAQFQQAQKMEALGTLAGGIAHDFNNLLMAIQGTASLLRYDLDPKNPVRDGLKDIEAQVESGAKLTAQLMGYARKGKYDVQPINLNRLVSVTSQAFARTKKEIRVHLDLSEGLLAIEADRGQIEQVLLNLMVNAADAMPAGGDLTLKTENVIIDGKGQALQGLEPGEYVMIKVSDTGVGIEPEIHDRIFDPFFTTKGIGRGTGLGLASVYGIIRNHGGRIYVESRKGQGASFTIFLPASRKSVSLPVEHVERLARGNETILLVDDERIVSNVGEQILKRLGYKVFTANSGKEALEIYQKNADSIDLIILDMIMPDIGGGEVFDLIKKVNPNAKVLLSTGYSIEGQAREILTRGCDGFIQKPFSMMELSEKIRKLLERGIG